MKKKSLIALIIAITCIAMTACGGNKELKTKDPQITISDVRETEKTESKTSIQSVEENSIKETTIDNVALDMIGTDKDEIIALIEDSDVTVEKNTDGITIKSDLASQRTAMIDSLKNYANEYSKEFRSGGDNRTFNYDIDYGYIDVYCSKEDIKDLEVTVNKVAGILAVGQRLNDNATPWVITVTISDNETSKDVMRIGVSSEEKFTISEDDWN